MTAIINGVAVNGSPEEIKKIIDMYKRDKINKYDIIKNEEITCELIIRQIEANKSRNKVL